MIIKKTIVVLFVLFFAAFANAADDKVFECAALTGGASNALDGIDGDDFSAGAHAKVTTATLTYFYAADASGDAESSPTVISPDTNAGSKRWKLTGIVALTLQGIAGTSINEFSTDGTLAGNSDDAAPTEKAVKTYVDGEIAGVAAVSNFAGYANRPAFSYKDTDEIYIAPGQYHHNGTSEQMVYWSSVLTFQFGPGGSNSDSSALGVSDWLYVYIDDSAVVTAGTNLLTASEFVAVTTEPTWSNTLSGFYSGDDRCIFAIPTNASSQIVNFTHDGGDYVIYDQEVTDLSAYNTTTTGAAVYLTMPSFSTRGEVHFIFAYNAGATAHLQYQIGTESGVHGVGYTSSTIPRTDNTVTVLTGANQAIKVLQSTNGANTATLKTQGYYFPRGM